MEFDLKKPYCYYFHEICQIPHGSYNEKALSDYVVRFAREHHLEYIQDEMNNVIIRKPATEEYKDYDPIMLQGHLDMVCEVAPDTVFDFKKQPIETYVDEEGNLRAKGTTLGADDGMGVAEMLAILSDSSLKHPELECVFTVQEEVGMFGALAMDTSVLKSHRMISLDGGGETSTAISSAGGVNACTSLPFTCIDNSDPCYEICVSGLAGGHSGGEIHKERGNANILAARIVKKLQLKGTDLHLISVSGGQKINAICRESKVKFSSSEDYASLKEKTEAIGKEIYAEFSFSDPGFKVECTPVETVDKVMDPVSTQHIIDFLYMVPNGFQHKSMEIEGLTLTSLNMGIVKTEEGYVECTSSIRSALEEAIDDLVQRISCIASYVGGKTTTNSRYPGWVYNPHSRMRETMNSLVRERYGKDLECEAGHGGLECAVFTRVKGGMDIITCGPIAGNCHTPQEYLNLESWDRTYALLTTFLTRVSRKA